MAPKTAKARWYHAWPTAWGPVGAAMGEAGLCGLVPPHYRLDELLELLAWEHPGSVRDDKPFLTLIELTGDYFNGRGADFSAVECEMPSQRSFAGRVLRACRQIAYGQTSTYGEIARSIDASDSARAVAAALGKNPIPLVIPCHRVTYSDGRSGGFSAPGGVDLKRRMLSLEISSGGACGPS